MNFAIVVVTSKPKNEKGEEVLELKRFKGRNMHFEQTLNIPKDCKQSDVISHIESFRTKR